MEWGSYKRHSRIVSDRKVPITLANVSSLPTIPRATEVRDGATSRQGSIWGKSCLESSPRSHGKVRFDSRNGWRVVRESSNSQVSISPMQLSYFCQRNKDGHVILRNDTDGCVAKRRQTVPETNAEGERSLWRFDTCYPYTIVIVALAY